MDFVYCKIPNISPELIEVRKHFFEGLYSGGLIFGGAYIRDFTVYLEMLLLVTSYFLKKRKALDSRKFSCGIFVNLQKALLSIVKFL